MLCLVRPLPFGRHPQRQELTTLRRVSATNCAAIFNNTNKLPKHHWHTSWQPYSFQLDTEHVWTAFYLHALLIDSCTYKTTLSVPHTGDQDKRFDDAIKARNARIALNKYREYDHACDLCTTLFVPDPSSPDDDVSQYTSLKLGVILLALRALY